MTKKILQSKLFFTLILCVVFFSVYTQKVNASVSASPQPDSSLYFNNTIQVILSTTTTTYVGGSFSSVSASTTGSGVPLLRSNGNRVTTFPRVSGGSIYTSVSDGNSGWYIGGTFTSVGGYSISNLAHILSNGTVDQSWNPNVTGRVNAIVLSTTSTMYIGGTFTSVNYDGVSSTTRNRLAEISLATGVVTSWDPNIASPSGTVLTLSLSTSTIYAGGTFSSINYNGISSTTRNNIAEISLSTGVVTSWNPNVNNTVNTLALSTTTFSLFTGGLFTTIGGITRNRIAEISLATGSSTSWDPNINGAVNALALSTNSTIYAGGAFAQIGGVIKYYIAEISLATGSSTSWDPGIYSGIVSTTVVNSLALSNTSIYVGGSFAKVGGDPRFGLAEISLATGSSTAWNPGASSNVYTIALSNSFVYVGGTFQAAGLTYGRNFLCSIDNTTKTLTDWNPQVIGSAGSYVARLALSTSTIFIGGNFTKVGDIAKQMMAEVSLSTGLATSFSSALTTGNFINALAVSTSSVYVSGVFTTIKSTSRNYLAEISLTTGTVTSWNPNLNGYAYQILLSTSTMYIGGTFTKVGGQTRNNVAEVSLSTGSPTSWNPSINNTVRTLALGSTTIYAGGLFTTVGGDTRNYLSEISLSTGSSTAWNPNIIGSTVYSLLLSTSTIYAGGTFTAVGSDTRNNLAEISRDLSSATLWNPNVGGTLINNVSYCENNLLCIGGSFSSLGNLDNYQNFSNFLISPDLSISFASSSSSYPETSGLIPIRVNQNTVSDTPTYFTYSITGGTAVAGVDYTPIATTTATIPAGATTYDIPITLIHDNAIGSDKTLQITIASTTGATLATPSVHTLTIQETDVPPVIQFATTTGQGIVANTVVPITISQNITASIPSQVTYTVTGGTASTSDYSLPTGTTTISALATSTTINLTLYNIASSAPRTVVITLSNPASSTLGANTTYTYTILVAPPTPVTEPTPTPPASSPTPSASNGPTITQSGPSFPGQITTMIIPTFTADDLAHLTQTSPTPSQTPTPQSSPVSAPLTLTHNITYRDTGTDVKALQTYLKNNKLFTGPITGYFGPLTLHAVKLYQKKYGIPQTGTVGPLTRKAMEK